MAYENISVGEFVPFGDAEAAVLTGADVDRCVGILGTRPPFRDVTEARQMDFDHGMQARELAISDCRAVDLALFVGEKERSIRTIVLSKTGALALRGGTGHIENDTIQLIRELDGGNEVLPIHAHEVRIG